MSSSYQFSPSKIPISESQYRSSSRTPNKYLDSNNGSTSKKPTYLARSEVVYSPEKTQFLSRLHDSTHVVDRELGAIKNQMENEHRRNVDTLLRSSAAIDRRNDELENVLRRLNLEIVAAKTHGSNSLKDKDLQRALGDKLNVSRIEKIKNDTAQKMDQVQFQINKIKEELQSSAIRSNEFRRKATEFESRSLLLSRSENRLRDYEERLNALTHEIHSKQSEIDNVRGQISALQLRGGDILVLEREIQNLKNIHDFKEKENEDLRQRKAGLETEIFKNAQNIKNLQAREIELLNQAENLRLKIVNVENQKNQEILQREKHYENQIHLNERTHNIEVDRLTVQLHALESELRIKSENLEKLRIDHNAIQNSLAVARVRASSAEKEANAWHVRANSAEIEKERETRIHRALRESAIDNTIKEHSVEQIHLENQANHVNHVLNIKESELINAKRSLIETDIVKSQIQATNHVLKSQVDDTVQRLDSSREKYLRESRTKDIIHESSLERLRIEHNSKRLQLEDQINALRSLVDVKRRELDEANRRGVQVSVELNNTELRKSHAEAAKNFWNHKAVEVEHVKNSQIIAHENIKNHEIASLQNSHYVDMSLKEREQLGLSAVYNSKERENLHLRLSNADLQQRVHQSSAEQINALTESDIWRRRSIEAENNRIINNVAQNNLRNSLVHGAEVHHSIEKNALINTANTYAHINTSNAIEANHMRNSYNLAVAQSVSPVRYLPHARIASALPLVYTKPF